MASPFQKFNCLSADIANGVHNFSTNQLVVALSNVLPTDSNSVLSDITQISYTNLSSRNITTVSSTQTGGLYSLVLQDLLLTASDAVPSFRYIIIYNDVPLSKPLVAWYDAGRTITLGAGDATNLDFTNANTLFQINIV